MISASAPRAARERGAAMRISLCTTRTPSPLRAILTMRSRSPAAGASPVSSTTPLVLATSMRVRAFSSSSRWTASPMAASMALSSTSGESPAALMPSKVPQPPRASANIIISHSGPNRFIVCITRSLSSTIHLEGVFDPVRRASVAFRYQRHHIETGRPASGADEQAAVGAGNFTLGGAGCRHHARREPIGFDAQRIQALQAGLLGPCLVDRGTQRIGILVEQQGHVGKQDAVEVAVIAGIGDTVVDM